MYLEIQLSRTCCSDRSLHCMQRRDVLISTYTETMKLTIFAYQGFDNITLRSMSSLRKPFIGSSYVLVIFIRDK
jgi:hypothetical protein